MSAATPAPWSPGPRPDTKERLLDAAEQLFAARGYERTSVRAVTRAAGVAVSAANYHFGSKEALLRAVLQRRVEPVNARRLELLAAVETEPGTPSLEAVIEAFVRPGFERRAEARSHGRASRSRQVAALLYGNPPTFVEELKRELFGPVHAAFHAALGRALPEIASGRAGLALDLVVGVMAHVMGGELEAEPSDLDELVALVVRFAAAGVRAMGPPGGGA